MNTMNKKGFTLLELLIVVSILAILSVILIIIINPAETLRKARDSQRLSDLSTLKSAIGVYATSTVNIFLSGASDNTECKTGAGGGTYTTTEDQIFYSIDSGTDITDLTLDATTFLAPGGNGQVAAANLALTDGTGWIGVNFNSLIGGSPISNLPVDPVNTVTAVAAVAASDLVYRYACNVTSLTFEINANLESTAFTTAPDNKEATDGGNNSSLYEIGSNLLILGVGTDF